MELSITIYHNGTCGKSHGALAILQQKNIPHNIRWYLSNPLTEDELKTLLNKLEMKASDLVRRDEAVFLEHYDKKDFTEQEWLTILAENPSLLQRPIIERGDKAIVARPPERVLEML
jgi:arsenate reductase